MLRVLDLGGEPAGEFATVLLALLGADVTKVEPPGGSRTRQRSRQTGEAQFDYLNRGKRSLVLDLERPDCRTELLALVREADALVEGLGPGRLENLGLDFETLRQVNERIVVASLSPFGREGPRAGWKATELVVQAMGGLVASSGHNDGPPTQLAGSQAAHVAGVLAATETLAAVRGARQGATSGVHIDFSIQEALSTHWVREIGRYVYTGEETPRSSRRLGLQGFPHTAEAADGWLFLLALRASWESLALFLGLDEFVTDEWSDTETRVERWDEIEPRFREALRSRGRYEWFATAAEHGFTFAPVDTPLDVLESPQLKAREFFGGLELADGATVQVPRLPFIFAGRTDKQTQAPPLDGGTETTT